ncbi:MAG: hypothetical protein DHS20C21_01780 [Gemmatimonadota bacterium]|nr:MAG: hypothetical protein DHS20C21_01780 [Gemmatimonadota bacterium]
MRFRFWAAVITLAALSAPAARSQEFVDWTYVTQFPDPPWSGSPFLVGLTSDGQLWAVRETTAEQMLLAHLGPGPWVAIAGDPMSGYMTGFPHCLAADGRVLCVGDPIQGAVACVGAAPHSGPWVDLKKWETVLYALDSGGGIWMLPVGTAPWQLVLTMTPGTVQNRNDTWAGIKARHR